MGFFLVFILDFISEFFERFANSIFLWLCFCLRGSDKSSLNPVNRYPTTVREDTHKKSASFSDRTTKRGEGGNPPDH